MDLSKFEYTPEKEKTRDLLQWQVYALQVSKEFGLFGPYKAMIFRYCKKNVSYVRGKVENAKEKFGTEKLEDKGKYLISLFRKNPPWIKK